MSKASKDDRIKRSLKFLTASTEPPIAKLLMSRGFDNEEREEGWALLDLATGRHLSLSPGQGNFLAQYNTDIGQLDDWENIWFDVAEAALKRKAPTIYERIFENLSKSSGIEVILTTRTFISRIETLKGDSSEEAQAAVALLRKRGLKDEVIAEAAALVSKLETVEIEDEPADNTVAKAAREKALKDLWAWFLDWSKTARTVVKNGNYRIMLGLTPPGGHSSSDDEVIDPLEDDDTSDDNAEPEPSAKAG